MIAIVPYLREDWDRFTPGEIERTTIDDMDSPVDPASMEGFAESVVEDGKVLAVFCILKADDETAVISMALSDEIRSRPMLLHRGVRKGLRDLHDRGFRKVVATNVPGYHETERWLARLGFEKTPQGTFEHVGK